MSTQKIVGDQALSALVSDIKSALSEKANTVGEYESLVSGLANNLKTDKGEINKTPYLFRRSYSNGYGYETLIGGTCGVNQLATGFITQTVDDLTLTNNNDGSITVNGTASTNGDINLTSYIHFLSSHKYMIRGYKKVGNNNGSFSFSGVGVDTGNGNIWNNDISDIDLLLRFAYSSGDAFNNVVMYPQIFDLTAYFGTTIADYVYTLESGTSGAGITWLKNNGFFGADYYPYNAGGLLSVKTSKKINRGFNQFDEQTEDGYISSSGVYDNYAKAIRSKNFNPCVPNAQYFFKHPEGMTGYSMCFYDSNLTFIIRIADTPNIIAPANARYFKLSLYNYKNFSPAYNNDICISFHSDLDGQYQPYVSHEYPLDDIELRGILKLDGNNNLYYDGDTYSSSGKVVRRFEYRAYTSGDESLPDTITDGTNTVTKLVTPTTETADPFTNPMIVDGNGTEEFVDTRAVQMPVGHSTFYLEDLKTKLENLPDFTDITGTLTAGNTSITLSSAKITTNSTIDFYTDTFGVNPTNVSVSNGSVTLTFDAQASNLGVKVRVS